MAQASVFSGIFRPQQSWFRSCGFFLNIGRSGIHRPELSKAQICISRICYSKREQVKAFGFPCIFRPKELQVMDCGFSCIFGNSIPISGIFYFNAVLGRSRENSRHMDFLAFLG